MLYLKLRQRLTTERQALAAMSTFSAFGGLISPRRERSEDGRGAPLYVVLIPGGRRPSAVLKQLRLQLPHAEWTLVDMDPEGFETEVMPEAVA